MKIVKFVNGTYGIRKWTLFRGYEYKDFSVAGMNNGWWWSMNMGYNEHIQCSKEFIKGMFRTVTDKGREVNFI